MGFGAAPSITAGIATIDIPMDYVSNLAAEEYGFEIDPSVAVALDGVGTITADLFFAKYDTANIGWDQEVNVGLTYEAGFMDALALTVEGEVTDITEEQGDLGWNVNVDAKYDMGTLAPYVVVDYGSNEDLDLSVGADLAVIDMATVTLDYTNGHVLDGATADSAEKGVITLAVAVEY
jgi:hypothetical protein